MNTLTMHVSYGSVTLRQCYVPLCCDLSHNSMCSDNVFDLCR
jgi:hypothetical protein